MGEVYYIEWIQSEGNDQIQNDFPLWWNIKKKSKGAIDDQKQLNHMVGLQNQDCMVGS